MNIDSSYKLNNCIMKSQERLQIEVSISIKSSNGNRPTFNEQNRSLEAK